MTLAKKKSPTRGQALEEARALHQSIAKRMSAAGFTHEKVKKDVSRVRINARTDSTRSH